MATTTELNALVGLTGSDFKQASRDAVTKFLADASHSDAEKGAVLDALTSIKERGVLKSDSNKKFLETVLAAKDAPIPQAKPVEVAQAEAQPAAETPAVVAQDAPATDAAAERSVYKVTARTKGYDTVEEIAEASAKKKIAADKAAGTFTGDEKAAIKKLTGEYSTSIIKDNGIKITKTKCGDKMVDNAIIHVGDELKLPEGAPAVTAQDVQGADCAECTVPQPDKKAAEKPAGKKKPTKETKPTDDTPKVVGDTCKAIQRAYPGGISVGIDRTGDAYTDGVWNMSQKGIDIAKAKGLWDRSGTSVEVGDYLSKGGLFNSKPIPFGCEPFKPQDHSHEPHNDKPGGRNRAPDCHSCGGGGPGPQGPDPQGPGPGGQGSVLDLFKKDPALKGLFPEVATLKVEDVKQVAQLDTRLPGKKTEPVKGAQV